MPLSAEKRRPSERDDAPWSCFRWRKIRLTARYMIEDFVITAAWVGEKEVACEQLARAEQLTGYGTITYGQLKLMPYWDPLRGDPRFEKIVASLAPKE